MPSRPADEPLLTQTQLARAVALGQRELQRRWLDQVPPNCIVGRSTRVRYTLDAVAAIHTARLRDTEHRLTAVGGDPELLGGESTPALERLRAAKAALAEYELQEKRGELVNVDELRPRLDRLSQVLRHLADRLSREVGAAAAQIADDAVVDWQREISEGGVIGDDGAGDKLTEDPDALGDGTPRAPADGEPRPAPEAPDDEAVRARRDRAPKRRPKAGKAQAADSAVARPVARRG